MATTHKKKPRMSEAWQKVRCMGGALSMRRRITPFPKLFCCHEGSLLRVRLTALKIPMPRITSAPMPI